MIIVTKKSEQPEFDGMKFYEACCPKCGTEFVFNSDDIDEHNNYSIMWISCPECKKAIIWYPNKINSYVREIPEEKYNKFL